MNKLKNLIISIYEAALVDNSDDEEYDVVEYDYREPRINSILLNVALFAVSLVLVLQIIR